MTTDTGEDVEIPTIILRIDEDESKDDEIEFQPLFQNMFEEEAKIIREQLLDTHGIKRRPIIHEIYGFRIEEDIEPFPIEVGVQNLLKKLKDDWHGENIPEMSRRKDMTKRFKQIEREQSISSSSEKSFRPKKCLKKLKFTKATFTNKQKKGGRRELANLLRMDFGPGNTPFQTFDPDEYVEELMIEEASKQQKASALVTGEERSKSKKDKEKKKSHIKAKDNGNLNYEKGMSSKTSEVKRPNERDSRSRKQSTESSTTIELEQCAHCERQFTDQQAVCGQKKKDKYCSRKCRDITENILLSPQGILANSFKRKNLHETNPDADGGAHSVSPTTSAETLTITINAQQKGNSPLGSAFTTVQPQMLNASGAMEMAAQQHMTNAAAAVRGFEFGHVSGPFNQTHGGTNAAVVEDQMFMVAGPSHHHHHVMQQMINQQQQQYPHHAHQYHNSPSPYYTHQLAPGSLQQQQQHINQQQQQQMMMMPPTFFANQFPMMHHQQFHHQPPAAIISPQLQSPPPPLTPITPVEKNADIDVLIAKGIQAWTPEEVAKWVIYVTKSEAIGEIFVEQEIDGSSLILLRYEQFQNVPRLKLGPAIKLSRALDALRGNPTIMG